jgi:hypothetical protein
MTNDIAQTADTAKMIAEGDLIDAKQDAFAKLAANSQRPRQERLAAWSLALALDAIRLGLDPVAAPSRELKRGTKKAITNEISRGRVRREPHFPKRTHDPLALSPLVAEVTELG